MINIISFKLGVWLTRVTPPYQLFARMQKIDIDKLFILYIMIYIQYILMRHGL